jgi:hypothetical protein
MVEPVRHRQTKEAGTDMFEPKATAPHLDSTATTDRGDSKFVGSDSVGFGLAQQNPKPWLDRADIALLSAIKIA